jgi:hypothetical protein
MKTSASEASVPDMIRDLDSQAGFGLSVSTHVDAH